MHPLKHKVDKDTGNPGIDKRVKFEKYEHFPKYPYLDVLVALMCELCWC